MVNVSYVTLWIAVTPDLRAAEPRPELVKPDETNFVRRHRLVENAETAKPPMKAITSWRHALASANLALRK